MRTASMPLDITAQPEYTASRSAVHPRLLESRMSRFRGFNRDFYGGIIADDFSRFRLSTFLLCLSTILSTVCQLQLTHGSCSVPKDNYSNRNKPPCALTLPRHLHDTPDFTLKGLRRHDLHGKISKQQIDKTARTGSTTRLTPRRSQLSPSLPTARMIAYATRARGS